MKKILARTPKSQSGSKTISFRARLGSSLIALAFVASISLISSRPAHTAGGPIAVTVANTPLATTATDNPAQQPMTVTQPLFNATPGGGAFGDFYTVPTGKRLVVDYVSSGAGAPNDTNHYSFLVTTRRNGAPQYANINELPDGSPYSAVSQKVQLFADAGTIVDVEVYSSGAQATSVFVTLTGHLVDVL